MQSNSARLTRQNGLLFSMTLAGVLATGALFAWSWGITWGWAIISQLVFPSQPNEQLAFTVEGEALVQTSTWSPRQVTIYRELDGRSIEDIDKRDLQQNSSWLPSGNLPKVRQMYWHSRIRGFSEPGNAPNFWYLVIDDAAQPTAYFVGFDAKTREQVGYLGLNGFRADRPPTDELFELDTLALTWNGEYAGQYGSYGEEPQQYWKGSPSAIFLQSPRGVYRIDLRRRAVALLPLDGKSVSVSNISQPLRVPDQPEAIFKQRIGVRLADRVEVFDEEGHRLRSIALPEAARDRLISVYLTLGEQAIVAAMPDQHHALAEIFWIAPDGSVAKTVETQLRGASYFSYVETTPLFTTLTQPSPLVAGLTFGLLEPRTMVLNGRYADFSTALAASLAEAWPAYLTLLVLSVVLAIWCYRRQRRYSSAGALAWSLFVLLAGPAGVVGYLTHRIWPARTPCPECHTPAPRDLQECLTCGEEFPAPEPLGIEIIA
jgi:hypothetical protein